MSFFKDVLLHYLKKLPEYLTIAFKLGILIGGVCIVSYSLRIGHYPRELSLGDGLLFLTTALAAGFIATFFIVSLLSTGITFSFVTKAIFKIIVFINNKLSNKKIELHDLFAPFSSFALFGTFTTLILMWRLWDRLPWMLFTFPLLSIYLYVFYSIFRSNEIKIKAINQGEKIPALLTDSDGIPRDAEIKNLRDGQIFASLGITLFPFIISGITPQLLDATMLLIHVRTENASVLLLEPYASMISDPAKTEFEIESKTWKRFDKVTILSAGYGKYSVISLNPESNLLNLEIPNDKIIVK